MKLPSSRPPTNVPINYLSKCLVEFGYCGTQYAVVVGTTRTGKMKVRKYRRRSDSWTKPINMNDEDIQRYNW